MRECKIRAPLKPTTRNMPVVVLEGPIYYGGTKVSIACAKYSIVLYSVRQVVQYHTQIKYFVTVLLCIATSTRSPQEVQGWRNNTTVQWANTWRLFQRPHPQQPHSPSNTSTLTLQCWSRRIWGHWGSQNT